MHKRTNKFNWHLDFPQPSDYLRTLDGNKACGLYLLFYERGRLENFNINNGCQEEEYLASKLSCKIDTFFLLKCRPFTETQLATLLNKRCNNNQTKRTESPFLRRVIGKQNVNED
ncbi:hypothetical protein NPIL_266181 [Nephila pilipes]|uniref:Uncharacterized protein n=1 Tax=Nephila pilipes TaxID=299642 RepID=A0A8X6PCI4_NEPPI|nr:hypothetical protein NPIL_266181 [Nephila pilipes]